MNAVGIDVSKGKSMMALAILSLESDTRVLMEATGRYHGGPARVWHPRDSNQFAVHQAERRRFYPEGQN